MAPDQPLRILELYSGIGGMHIAARGKKFVLDSVYVISVSIHCITINMRIFIGKYLSYWIFFISKKNLNLMFGLQILK